jgi:hypothetical protein
MALNNLASPVNYNVTPVDFSPIANIGLAYNQGQQQKKQQAQKEATIKEAQDIMKSGDLDAMADFSLANEGLGKRMFEMNGIRDEAAQNRVIGTAKSVLQSQSPVRDLKSSIAQGEAMGRDMAHSKKMLEAAGGNPELLKKIAATSLSLTDPKGYKSYKSSLPEMGEAVKTATGKDFSQYNKLKQTDPDAAKQFGTAAGFINDKPKRLFQVRKNDDGTTTKYFSDGTESVVPANAKVKTPDMKAAMSQEQAMKVLDKAKEGQLKNAGFATTMKDGLDNVNTMVDKGYDPMNAAWINKYLSGTTIGNLAMSPEDQTFVGSTEQMINAIARRETGAAITDFEKKDFFNRYMPTAGDKPARIKQKRDALERQFKSIRGQSGSTYDALRMAGGFDEPQTQEAGAAIQQQAPASAIDYLRQNPNAKEMFMNKYGYLPEGM